MACQNEENFGKMNNPKQVLCYPNYELPNLHGLQRHHAHRPAGAGGDVALLF